MKIVSDSRNVNMRAARSAIKAALAARCRSVARGWRTAFVVLVAACCLLVVVAALQVLFVGSMDSLGVAPQVSFLCLNIALVALLTLFALPSMRLNLRGARWRAPALSEAAESSGEKLSIAISVSARPVCKVLVIRRRAKEKQADTRATWITVNGRSDSSEAAFNAYR